MICEVDSHLSRHLTVPILGCAGRVTLQVLLSSDARKPCIECTDASKVCVRVLIEIVHWKDRVPPWEPPQFTSRVCCDQRVKMKQKYTVDCLIRSLELSFPGTFVPRNLRSLELSFP